MLFSPYEPTWRQALAGARRCCLLPLAPWCLMPLITGMDPNVALFTAGIGTLVFQLVTKRQVHVGFKFCFCTHFICQNQLWFTGGTRRNYGIGHGLCSAQRSSTYERQRLYRQTATTCSDCTRDHVHWLGVVSR